MLKPLIQIAVKQISYYTGTCGKYASKRDVRIITRINLRLESRSA